MKDLLIYICKKWYKFIFHLLSLILIILLFVFDNNLVINDFLKFSLSISFTLSLYFTFNLAISYNKSLIKINQKLEIDVGNLSYVNKTYEFNNTGTINQNIINSNDGELPELTIDIIKYHVNLHPFAILDNSDKIIFDESFIDVYGKVVYAVMNSKEIIISFDKPFEIIDYIKNAEWVKLENGHALVEKSKHLIGFRVYNFSDKPLSAFNLSMNDEKYNIKYKEFNPILIKPKEEISIFILLNDLKTDSKYNLELKFFCNNKCYSQNLEMKVSEGNLSVPLILTKPTECPPSQNKNS